MSSGSDLQSAPPGVLIPNTSASTGTLSSGNVVGGPTAGGPPLAPPPTPRRLPTPLRPSDFGSTDVLLLMGAALASLALVWVVFYQLTLLSGALGFLVCWYLVFVGLTWVGTAQVIERQVATDRVVAVVVVSAALLMVSLVVFIVMWVAFKAIPHVHWGSLFTRDQKHFVPSDPNILGKVGIAEAIVGTLEQVAVATIVGVPLAIATAVFLNAVSYTHLDVYKRQVRPTATP